MNHGPILLTIGALLLVALAADAIGRRTGLPRVTTLVLTGIAIGPNGLDLLPAEMGDATEFVAAIALVMVAFLLGAELSRDKLRRTGWSILVVSLAVVIVTAAVVWGGLMAIGLAAVPALLLGAASTATDPMATRDVISEFGVRNGHARARSFSERLLGIVAVDDAWGLVVFGIAMGAAAGLDAGLEEGAGWMVAAEVGWELFGAIAVGVAVGVPACYLTGRVQAGEPSQAEALGITLFCGGAAMWLGVSYLLAAIVTGAMVANFARHHSRSFREVEQMDFPFLVLFFVLAGASLDIDAVIATGAVGGAYIALRLIGRLAGGWIGGRMAGLSQKESLWIGVALTPQAGVALGMALVAAAEFPEYRDVLLAVTVAATVVFELFGPVLTRLALSQVAGQPEQPAQPEQPEQPG